MYWNPTNSTHIPENQKPPQTQKLRKSEFLSFRGRVSEFPRQFRPVLALAQKVQNTTFTVVGRILGVFVPDFFGQNRATQKLRLKISETQTQKLVFRVSESDFPSFRVRLSEFPKLRGFRAVRVRVDSNTLGPLKVTFPIFSGIFPICSGTLRGFSRESPFPLSRPINSAYEEQSRKGLGHNRIDLDLSRKKWEAPRVGNPPV